SRPQLRKAPAQCGELRDEVRQIVAIASQCLPFDPADLVVLAISVVVAVLAVADFVAGQQQRHALGKEKRREMITPKLAAKVQNLRIVGWAFDAAIGALVAIGAIAVLF